MWERTRFEAELRDLEIEDESFAFGLFGEREDLWFEFDLNFGMENSAPPTSWIGNKIPDDTVLTIHTKKRDKFRVKSDGNRMEISTKKVSLTDTGRAELDSVMTAVLTFASELESGCSKAKPQTVTRPRDSLARGRPLGRPRFFVPAFTLVPGAPWGRPVFPLGGKGKPYFLDQVDQCSVSASPQANMDIPLSAVDALVAAIKASAGGPPGIALTGSPSRRNRQGLCSQALFDAQKSVNASMKNHIKRATRRGGVVVTERNFTRDLQGFMILLVQYLRTSEIEYGPEDKEAYAKGYVPLLSKTHFRDLFHKVLNKPERDVFLELYGKPNVRDSLYALAGRPGGGGTRNLFPEDTLRRTDKLRDNRDRVQRNQYMWFGRHLTWDDLVQYTIDDTKLLNASGEESLFTAHSKATNGPPVAGPKGAPVMGVQVELRRLGFGQVPSDRWKKMTERVFTLAQKLNNTA